MSDSHMPDFTERDSSWEKAVNDVISDSIKVEKKLQNALKNQRKVNKNLEMIRFSSLRNTPELDKCMISPHGNEPSESGSEQSTEEDEPPKSKYLKDRRAEENKAKTPDRPMLGNGSLEKMKKSQNSFNVEPMGSDELNEDDVDYFCEDSDVAPLGALGVGERKIHYLHFKDDSDFERSDSDSSISPEAAQERNPIQKLPNITEICRESPAPKQLDSDKKVPVMMSACKTKQNSDLDTRLHLALAKRDILNENLKAMSIGNSCHKIQVKRSVMKIAGKNRKAKELLTPFMNFYLEVYRELCHKCSEKQISEEAARRWWTLSPKKRASYAKLRRRK